MSRAVFDTEKVFIIAEAGVNHNGSMDMAKALIDGAARAQADAVKFQLFDPEKLTSKVAPMAAYQQRNNEDAQVASQQDLLKSLALPPEAFRELQHYAQQQGIMFLCTPFDEDSALFLHHELKLPCLKISSGELTNLQFLEMLGDLNTPVILSTGMGTLEETLQAVNAVWKQNKAPLGLLHCVSAYPAPIEAINLRAINTLAEAFPECVVGYSDHTLGVHIPVAAVALGARIIEKHFTLDKTLPGPDHQASLTVEELCDLVTQIRQVASALGDGVKRPQPCELDCINAARKSLVAANDLPAGHILTREDIAIKRPGSGISPSLLEQVLGLPIPAALAQDALLPPSLLQPVPSA
jgi:N,N'-diacetyllegionaminate synthase